MLIEILTEEIWFMVVDKLEFEKWKKNKKAHGYSQTFEISIEWIKSTIKIYDYNKKIEKLQTETLKQEIMSAVTAKYDSE